MQPINQFLIFEFGAKVKSITSLSDEALLREAYGPATSLETVLEGLVQGRPILLDYSMASIREALKHVKAFIRVEYFDKEGNLDFEKDWNQRINPWLINGLKTSLVKLEHNLAAEFEKTATYLVSKTTSFDTATLIEHATETLTSDVREVMSEMAIFDYTQAGRCLGFGLHTAAGFHVARATEAVMLSYCETFLDELKEEDKHTWGQLLSALAKCKKSPRPDKSTIAILEQIKNVDRNDLMHPRKRLDLTEASRLFYFATGAIIAMAMEIRAKKGAADQKQLFEVGQVLIPDKSAEAAE